MLSCACREICHLFHVSSPPPFFLLMPGWLSRRMILCGYGSSYWCVRSGSPWWGITCRPTSTWHRRVWIRWRRKQDGLVLWTCRRWCVDFCDIHLVRTLLVCHRFSSFGFFILSKFLSSCKIKCCFLQFFVLRCYVIINDGFAVVRSKWHEFFWQNCEENGAIRLSKFKSTSQASNEEKQTMM